MGLFKYPYTDLNELNLDWVIARIKELTEYVATITQASKIEYDNTGTILSAENVQTAINEILTVITTGAVTSFNGRTGAVVPAAHDYTAQQIDYDKTGTTLTSDDAQSAISELAARPLGGVQSFNGRTGAIVPGASDYDATDIAYDNTTSGMTATTTQGALDELDDRLDNFSVSASQVSYDNTQSGLTATDVQAALDEIANDVLSSGVASFNGRTGAVNPAAGDYDASDITYDNTGSGLIATDSQGAIDELDSSVDNLIANQGKQIATVEGATASRAYAIGETFIDSDGYTCQVTAAVSSGASWVLNTNYTRMTIGEMLYGSRLIYTAAQDGTKTRRQLAAAIVGKVGALNHRKRLIVVENSLVYHLHNENGHNIEFVCVDINTSSAVIHTIGVRNDNGRCFDVNLLTQTITDDTSVATYDMELYEI